MKSRPVLVCEVIPSTGAPRHAVSRVCGLACTYGIGAFGNLLCDDINFIRFMACYLPWCPEAQVKDGVCSPEHYFEALCPLEGCKRFRTVTRDGYYLHPFCSVKHRDIGRPLQGKEHSLQGNK